MSKISSDFDVSLHQNMFLRKKKKRILSHCQEIPIVDLKCKNTNTRIIGTNLDSWITQRESYIVHWKSQLVHWKSQIVHLLFVMSLLEASSL